MIINDWANKIAEEIHHKINYQCEKDEKEYEEKVLSPSYFNVRQIIYDILKSNIEIFSQEITVSKRMINGVPVPKEYIEHQYERMAMELGKKVYERKDDIAHIWEYENHFEITKDFSFMILRAAKHKGVESE